MDFLNQNSAEGQRLDPNFKIDFDKEIKIKSPKAIKKEELFEKIMLQLEKLDGKKELR